MSKEQRLSKFDYILMFVITLFYSILSFYNLGSLDNPNTFVHHKNIELHIDKNRQIHKMRYFTGHEMGNVKIKISKDGKNYKYLDTLTDISVFSWNDFEIDKPFQFIRLEIDKDSNIGELALYDDQNQKVKLKAKDKNAFKVIDEQKTVPKKISYLNSTYFDEIYFARTAYEYANNLPAYEWVHPPLGKLIMAFPIKIFKMAPFYYRLMGNIAGILMIPILYIFSKRMFKKTKYAFLSAIFICMDGFHFAHTRMATVDSFLVLFILLSFLFMYEYFLLKEVPFQKRIQKLFLSGLFMGCAISVKWTGLFASLALAVLFFIHFYKNDIKKNKITNEGKKILLYCILFFVIFPFLLYFSLYFLFPNMKYFQTSNIKNIKEITLSMFSYHSSLKEPHPFYSSFYTWPFMIKPVWYYTNTFGNIESTISGFGNPILWWMSSLSMIFIFYKAFKKDKNALFLSIVYLCMFIPYFKISRGMFLYHYFPVLPFTFLALTYCVKEVTEKRKHNYFYMTVLIFVCFFFYYFFPIVSGKETLSSYIENLKWFSSWIF